MASVILIENGADQAAMKRSMTALTAAGCSSMVIVANSMPEGLTPGQTYISSSTNSLAEAMQQAITRSASETVIFIDARMNATTEMVAAMLSEMNGKDSGFTYAGIETGSDTMSLGEVNSESLISMLSTMTMLPLVFVAARRSTVDACDRLEGENMIEIMTKVLIESVVQGEAISQTSQMMQMSAATAQNMCGMSIGASARCLRKAVDSFNIEDLFPHHAWTAHREESAAASYHTLAAAFIRLGDSDSALECLALGDQFEDSPRSLALKGLIALDKGQTLAAVANMVSSLQQYEMRKKHNNKHYVHFAPRDLASINSNLNAGLEALNKKDNSAALEHFASAVFSFDPFFSENGVTALKAGH